VRRRWLQIPQTHLGPRDWKNAPFPNRKLERRNLRVEKLNCRREADAQRLGRFSKISAECYASQRGG
jgi:hypothetical protein